ncbi:Git3 multi-domain protein [Pyrenophora tritici-repentis]|nr:Git3 multi-domain protein [Pyrenophora tritici-repentis]
MAPYDMSSILDSRTVDEQYFQPPDSMDPLTPAYKAGMVPLAVCAMLSLFSVAALLGFITQRMISWRRHYRQYVGYNQYVILIFNLLIADLQQSIAFSISFHWLRLNKILAPTGACFIQAWFLQIGDVASGFFVLAIGIHTWLGVVKGYKLPYLWFVVAILSIWFFALFLTVLGLAMHRDRYFARAAAWCWVSSEYQGERLWLHYLWIFIVEFGTIIIYAHIFFHLRHRIRNIVANDTRKLTRANKFMVMYPAVYVILTLPIAVGRMVAMTGEPMSENFYIIAGCLLTSCGWIDALLYTLTRRVLVSGDLSAGHYNQTLTANLTNAARPGDTEQGHFGLQSVGKNDGITTNARTVTITGGTKRSSHLSEHRRGRSHMIETQRSSTINEESPTRTGSQDSIIRTKDTGISIVTETSVQVETSDEKEMDAGIPLIKD